MRHIFENLAGPGLAIAMILGLTGGGATAAAEDTLVIATTGGTWEKAMRTHFFDPFTKETRIRVITVSGTGAENVARIKAMAQTGNVEWDLYQAGEIQAASELHRSLNEDMTEFCRTYNDDQDLLPGACAPSGVLSAYGTTLLAYNTDAFPAGLKSWAEFFDVQRFPGPRSMPNFNDPWRVMAAALLADGVEPSALFPLDVDRALAKLDTIRPHISLWWKTGDQSTQGFRSGEYVAGEIWQTRASALQEEGQPLAWSQKQAFLVGDRWALIRNAPHRAAALKFLTFFLAHPEAQAKVCEALTCTPVRYSAAKAMSAKAQAASPTSPEVFDKLIRPDADWINANNQILLERWNEWNQR
ncbi:ABC transporter substrate-binding protein [Rhizobium sp. 16-449-1b]|uniref:ABC transporter substrate-binding protein n=1 Tax=Rhizobium sp. 16-449-1b TaxID=2819989 RepID=UPI001ADA80B7|nr:ABC transporter substrate-binding protein [Rhizobium sp. 16-449-1b]MBO9195159.1 ABC transporter substrate-binding protein [Rhizobium sp. 16-449-1b]